MFGKCKVCLEKDQRIEDLKREILYLRELANPKLNVHIPAISAEADKITSVSQDVPLEDDEILSERLRLLSGTY